VVGWRALAGDAFPWTRRFTANDRTKEDRSSASRLQPARSWVRVSPRPRAEPQVVTAGPTRGSVPLHRHKPRGSERSHHCMHLAEVRDSGQASYTAEVR